MRATSITLAALALALGGCGVGPESVGARPETESPGEMDRPPNLDVTGGDTELVLNPYAYCWWFADGRVECADGAPPQPLPSLTLDDSSDLELRLPLDWPLEASFLPDGEFCRGGFVTDLGPGGGGLRPLGPAGTFGVEVFGHGAGGSGAWAFELVTTSDHPLPPPFAQVLWSPGQGNLEPGTPFSVQVGNVTDRPSEVSAAVTITASNNATGTFDMTLGDDGGCWSSTIGAQGGPGLTEQMLSLGPPPYALVVEVELDAKTLISQPITWPDDFPPDGNESSRATADLLP